MDLRNLLDTGAGLIGALTPRLIRAAGDVIASLPAGLRDRLLGKQD